MQNGGDDLALRGTRPEHEVVAVCGEHRLQLLSFDFFSELGANAQIVVVRLEAAITRLV